MDGNIIIIIIIIILTCKTPIYILLILPASIRGQFESSLTLSVFVDEYIVFLIMEYQVHNKFCPVNKEYPFPS